MLPDTIGQIFSWIFIALLTYIASHLRLKLDRLEQGIMIERHDHNLLKDVVALPFVWDSFSEHTQNFLRKDFGIRRDEAVIISSAKLSPEQQEKLRDLCIKLQGKLNANDVIISIQDYK